MTEPLASDSRIAKLHLSPPLRAVIVVQFVPIAEFDSFAELGKRSRKARRRQNSDSIGELTISRCFSDIECGHDAHSNVRRLTLLSSLLRSSWWPEAGG